VTGKDPMPLCELVAEYVVLMGCELARGCVLVTGYEWMEGEGVAEY